LSFKQIMELIQLLATGPFITTK